MKICHKNQYLPLLVLTILLTVVSCTKLDTKIKDPNSEAPQSSGGAPTPSSLSKVYEELNKFVGEQKWFALNEQSTDEMVGPTRGTDWDDFGKWRKIHL